MEAKRWLINVNDLTNWLHDRICDEISCYEDLEMTEGVRNDFHRGKVKAFEDVLEELT